MDIMRWDPFAELEELQNQILGSTTTNQPAIFAPATDVYIEDDKQLVVEADLPGFSEKDVEVKVNDGVLEIRAERKESEEEKSDRRYIKRESATSFYRSILLPKEADESKVSAELEDGKLRVVVPFKELPQPKKVLVKPKKKGSKK